MKKRPLSYYEHRDYIVDDAFLEEYKHEIKELNRKSKIKVKK